jgi:hypothetical protein
VTNSTIADNRVTDPGDRPGSLGGYGGGIDIRGTGTVQIVNSTLTRNSSSRGGGGINIAPAYLDSLPAPLPDIVDLPLGRMTLRNSIIAGNTADGAAADCQKAFATIRSPRRPPVRCAGAPRARPRRGPQYAKPPHRPGHVRNCR